jgi:antitoxin (DNA-binding transcriptional repressor) of toxin-antitoxin stability system
MRVDEMAIGWLLFRMASYSVAEARNNLSRLIDEALKGEAVTITRHGQAVVELKAKNKPLKLPDPAALRAWAASPRHDIPPMTEDEIVALIRDVRLGRWDENGNPR